MKQLAIPSLLLAAGLTLSGSMTAQAVLPIEGRAAGLWYTDQWFNFDDLSKHGNTGAGVKVAVIDAAINPDVPELQGANIQIMGSTCIDPDTDEPWEAENTDPRYSAHGTNAVAMLVGNGIAGDGGPGARGIAPDAEIMFYGTGPLGEEPDADGRRSYWDTCVLNDPTVKPGQSNLLDDLEGVAEYGSTIGREPFDNRDGKEANFAKALIELGDSTALAARAAIRDGADVISISVDSGNTPAWDQVMIEALHAGVPVVVATDNPTDDLFSGGLTRIYQVNGIVPVNAVEQDGSTLQGGANYAAPGSSNLAGAAPGRDLLGVGHAETGWGPELIHGTSFATPLVAGTIALGLQAFPDATANQVLQAMIRTTNDGVLHEPIWTNDTVGYGFINPGGLLQSDPTEFPDENPLFVTSIDDPRCVFPNGQPVKEDIDGTWYCNWANHPTPATVEAYWSIRESGNNVGPGENPSAEAAGTIPGWAFAAGGLGLLVVIAVAVVVPITVSRSKKRAALAAIPQHHQTQYSVPAQNQQPAGYHYPQQQYQPPQDPGHLQPPSLESPGQKGDPR